jgi:uncharacterized membrane protein
MIESFYALLEKIGFSHPLHPMLTHVPMGMIIGMVVFSFLGLVWRKGTLDRTAYHCSVLALVSILPVIGAGMLDWAQFFEGEWSNLIVIKMILGALLTVLLAVAVVVKRKGGSPSKMFLIYLLCLACAGGLGYSGGTLVYG